MIVRNRVALVAATALTCAGLLGGAPATAVSPTAAETPAKVTVIASGLEGPRQLTEKGGFFYVAEADAGQVTRIRRSDRTKRVVVRGLPDAQGVAHIGNRIYATTGEVEGKVVRRANAVDAKVYVAKPFARPRAFADPYTFELRYNPDNQDQFDPKDGHPLDAVSNPYYLIEDRGPGFMLLAAAGGNDVLSVSKKGTLSPFFVPSAITTGVCEGKDQNSPAGPSCDTTPTGLAYGPNGNLYVSGLSGLAPNEGRVYVVNRYGKLLRTLTGFSNSVGVAVGPDGSVYVSDLLQGAPAPQEPAADAARASAKAAAADDAIDPKAVGQIVKVAPDGKRTYAQVTMPSGLLFKNGVLYANTWAIAGQFGISKAGQTVAVDPSSFVAK
jgi:hypothetical protein